MTDRNVTIGEYIRTQEPVEKLLKEDENIDIAEYMSTMANGLFAWYEFKRDSEILMVGSWFGAYAEMLSERCHNLTVIEPEEYRYEITKKRLERIRNVKVIKESLTDHLKKAGKYDYVVWSIDEKVDRICTREVFTDCFYRIKAALTTDGKLLFATPNRFGIKYFCGEPDPSTHIRFQGMTDQKSLLYRFDRDDLYTTLQNCGYHHIKFYYPFPDHRMVLSVYSDEYPPKSDIRERVWIYAEGKNERVLDEPSLVDYCAGNDALRFMANSYLVEAGLTDNGSSDIIYATISAERDRDYSFATCIKKDCVYKIPLYREGFHGLNYLLRNTHDLKENGIPVLDMELRADGAAMRRVTSPSLSVYISQLVKNKDRKVISILDRLWEYIKSSSEHVPADDNCMLHKDKSLDWGIILKRASLEMIPVNCFYEKEDFLFYDQEFTRDNCPAGYVMYRAVRDLYENVPEIEEMVSFEDMKSRYGLSHTWNYFDEEEKEWQKKLRNRELYSGFQSWIKHPNKILDINRENLMKTETIWPAFNLFDFLDGKRIILFGTGKFAQRYLKQYNDDWQKPIWVVDNNSEKWGQSFEGFEIKPPTQIWKLMPGSYQIIVAVKDYSGIVEQLLDYGISTSDIRVYDPVVAMHLPFCFRQDMNKEGILIGYISLLPDRMNEKTPEKIRTVKSMCKVLYIGVPTDEYLNYKGIKREESYRTMEQKLIKGNFCDKVIPIDAGYDSMIAMWDRYRYTALFELCDDIDENDWIWKQRKLYSLGIDSILV